MSAMTSGTMQNEPDEHQFAGGPTRDSLSLPISAVLFIAAPFLLSTLCLASFLLSAIVLGLLLWCWWARLAAAGLLSLLLSRAATHETPEVAEGLQGQALINMYPAVQTRYVYQRAAATCTSKICLRQSMWHVL